MFISMNEQSMNEDDHVKAFTYWENNFHKYFREF